MVFHSSVCDSFWTYFLRLTFNFDIAMNLLTVNVYENVYGCELPCKSSCNYIATLTLSPPLEMGEYIEFITTIRADITN